MLGNKKKEEQNFKPNILLIHADQHRYDCIGCYGNKDVKTPNIDMLAKEGTKHTNHYTVYPVCTPSRYSMLSGLYVHQHLGWTNRSTLPGGIETFPKLLKDSGYHTAAVGKMHFTPTYLDVGFDKMVLAEQNGKGRYEDDYHTYLMERGLVDNLDITDQVNDYRKKGSEEYHEYFGTFESDLPIEHHSTTWITNRAIKELDEWDEKGNNMLMIGYIKPHHPFDPPHPYSRMYSPEELTILDGFTEDVPDQDYSRYKGFFDYKTLTEKSLRRMMAHYYGTITHIDDSIGEIIDLLKKKNLYDNTMIIYTSDHGDYLGFHHMALKGCYLYDPLTRIPLIIKYPNVENSSPSIENNPSPSDRGVICEGLSENIDLFSTILSVALGYREKNPMRIDLSKNQEKEFVFAEEKYRAADGKEILSYMIRTSEYKLIINGSFENVMFFDLIKDKNEIRNEISNPKYKKEIDNLKARLIDRLVFSGVSLNHLDIKAPQLKTQDDLDHKSEELIKFIKNKIEPF